MAGIFGGSDHPSKKTRKNAGNPFLPPRKMVPPGERLPEDAPVLPALLDAAKIGHTHNLNTLLQAGVSPELHTRTGYRPLHWAARENHLECIKKLVDFGADIEAETREGQTPLSVAASKGKYQAIQALVAVGADVNAVDRYGWTPAHYAADAGHLRVLKVLIATGANINSLDRDDEKPANRAAANGHTECVDLIDDYIASYGSAAQYALEYKAAADDRERARLRRYGLHRPSIEDASRSIASTERSEGSTLPDSSRPGPARFGAADTSEVTRTIPHEYPLLPGSAGAGAGDAGADDSAGRIAAKLAVPRRAVSPEPDARFAAHEMAAIAMRDAVAVSRLGTPIPRLDLESAGIGGGSRPLTGIEPEAGQQLTAHDFYYSTDDGSALDTATRRSTQRKDASSRKDRSSGEGKESAT